MRKGMTVFESAFTGVSRRVFLGGLAVGAAAMGMGGVQAGSAAVRKGGGTVRDHLWVWAHDTRAYHGPAYGLPGNSALTPVEGVNYLDVPNIIFIRYEGKPERPFESYFEPFKTLNRVMWSITGAGGATSDAEREAVFRLAAANPNITGVFMDDFFQFSEGDEPQWLAENNVTFPVSITVTLPKIRRVDAVMLTQSCWNSGDYRSRDVAIEVSSDGAEWRGVGVGTLPKSPAQTITITFPEMDVKAFRVRILNTHDVVAARSCGLRRLVLACRGREVPLAEAQVEASSTYPGHDAGNVLRDVPAGPVAASLSVQQLQSIRRQLDNVGGRRLDLGVTLYTHQLDARIAGHLELCDIISLWTWKSEDLSGLEENFERLTRLAPEKRILLGCYMWDFGIGKAIPIDRMERQCEAGLKWLQERRIEGLIFLATNICDLNLEAVEWTRRWIARCGKGDLGTGDERR